MENRLPRVAAPVLTVEAQLTDLSKQFEQLMREKRFSNLQRECSKSPSRTNSPAPSHGTPTPLATPDLSSRPTHQISQPSQQLRRKFPIYPEPPQDPSATRFCNNLSVLSAFPTNYENPGLLDEALVVIPLDRIYSEADEHSQILQAKAASLGLKPTWGYQDYVIKALLKWFKGSFFTFIRNPQCSRCLRPTIAHGIAPPTPEEIAHSAAKVELYRCSDPRCGAFERFPRYSDVWQLLQTRRGRVGEWANCFTMLCRAVGSRVRWVWNSEDYVWTEVYSEHQRRWIHVDPCEGIWDQPRLYTEGWGRKLAYCIAFSIDGATDVTRRYVRFPAKYAAPRSRAPEEAILWTIHEIRRIRREKMSQKERERLVKEDIREEKEFRGYIVEALALQLRSLLNSPRNSRSEDQKTPISRQEGAAEWLQTRQSEGTGRSGPDRGRERE